MIIFIVICLPETVAPVSSCTSLASIDVDLFDLESSSRASSLAKQMDNTNTTKLCREDFDYVFDKLISRTHNFKADIQAAVESDPLMTMQDIYLKMALKVKTLPQR